MKKDSIFAPYDCISEREAYPELRKGFQFYSQPNCEVSAVQRVYNEWFHCNVPAMPIFNGVNMVFLRENKNQTGFL